MSRLPASALEEGDHIHAILRPLLAEQGAAQRRANALAARPEPRALAYAELDQVIDSLLLRMRVDPRPPKQKTKDAPRLGTRDVAKPATRESLRPGAAGVPQPRTEPSIPPVPDVPPPVPQVAAQVPQVPQPPQVPSRADAGPPPVPPASSRPATTRNLERPVTGPVPDTAVLVRQAPPVPPRKASPPVQSADAATGPLVLARPGNAPETFLLYDDIVMLSAMNDRDGLLISLERLLVLSKLEDHVRVFIDANEPKLVGLYESQLKAFSKVPKRRPAAVDNTMPRVFLRGEKIAAVLLLIDGKAAISDIVARAAPLTRIETLSVIAQLQRAGIVEV